MKNASTLLKAIVSLTALLVVTIVAAPPSFAKATLEVSASQNLKDGQKIDISGGGYKPGLTQIAVGQCIEGYTGPSHCNLQGGATFRNADASGSIGSFSVVVKEKFGAHDCTKVKCVLASGPLPTVADAATVKANQVIIPITFGGAPAAEAPAETPAAAPAADERAATDDELPKTGVADSLPMIMMAGLVLLLAGAGLRLGTRRPGGVA
ncbi:LPXTG cell wall anchor domain-containing protein [Nocardioides sp. zg-536]|uniref:LPXTG cell wall anchor domain-containing protein n=1 Tax=Nocardioides faecalis TaxID=2803858 RepID=A0A938Y6K8_9ACTN|nr:neocarzinostatin apoprotein domain-containing protein [Nocardioides faecalis]MBM9459173.1 LPXTG cell wall anchor domain-containing protein [Nocardioides faecalis]MBS4751421.1 LPXTG cell wall anchor domain-containing protein [Nocardioides faecalis]QVI60484.1 LPXTG cell wall anchor domain-containing protein [Nocardioides faecalis]